MSASVSVQVVDNWAIKVREWIRIVGANASEGVRYHAGLFLKDAIRFTPPKNKPQGENAIKRQLSRVFNPVASLFVDEIGSRCGISNIDTFHTPPGKQIPWHLKWKRLDPSGRGMAEFHKSRRDSRGRVSSGHGFRISRNEWEADYVVAYEQYAEYLQATLNKVGRMKAGWISAADQLGLKVPPWIARHRSGARSWVSDVSTLNDQIHPSITIKNSARGVGQIAHVIESALKKRAQAMVKDGKYYLLGKKNWPHVRGQWIDSLVDTQ